MSFADVTILKSWTPTRSRLLTGQRTGAYVVDVQYCSASPFYPWLYPQETEIPSLITILDTTDLHVFIVRLVCSSSTQGYGGEVFDKIDPDDYDQKRQVWSYLMGSRDPPARSSKPSFGPPSSQHPSMQNGVGAAVFDIFESEDCLKVCSDLDYLRRIMRIQFGANVANAVELPNVSSVGENSVFYVPWTSRYVLDQVVEDLRRRVRSMHQQWLNMEIKPLALSRRRRSQDSACSQPSSDRGYDVQSFKDRDLSHHDNAEISSSGSKKYNEPQRSSSQRGGRKTSSNNRRLSPRTGSRDSRPRRRNSVSRDFDDQKPAAGLPRARLKYKEIDLRTRASLELDLLKSAINRFPSPSSNSKAYDRLSELCEELHFMVIDLQHELHRCAGGQYEHADSNAYDHAGG